MVNLTLKISPCDITTLKADVLVSSIHRSKDMSKGPLSSHVKSKCGQQVQNKLNKFYGQRNFSHGEVVKTSAEKLASNFQQLFFVCLYCWRPGNDVILEAAVKKCLETASSIGFTSIAFPALGMGGQSYPPFDVAKSIITAILKYLRDNPDTTIQIVHIALKDKDINSTRTFVQTTIAVLEGFHLGRQSGKGDSLGFEGVETFHGLQSTKPSVTSQKQGSTTSQATSGMGVSVSGVSGNVKNVVNFNVQPYASLSRWTVGVRADVSLDLSSFVHDFLKNIVGTVRKFFNS